MSKPEDMKSEHTARRLEPIDKYPNNGLGVRITYRHPDGTTMYHLTDPGLSQTVSAHAGGSFDIHYSDGTHQSHSMQSSTYSQGGSGSTTDHNSDGLTGGASRTQSVSEGYHSHAGDKSSFAGGDQAHVTIGKYNHAAKQMYFGSGSSIAFNATGDCEIKAGGKLMLNGSQVHINGVAMSGGGGGGGKG